MVVVFFCGLFFFGGLFGDCVFVLIDQMKVNIWFFVELIEVVYEKYGEDVFYCDFVYGLIYGMLCMLDFYMSFFSKEVYVQMCEKQQVSFYGLGIYVGQCNG